MVIGTNVGTPRAALLHTTPLYATPRHARTPSTPLSLPQPPSPSLPPSLLQFWISGGTNCALGDADGVISSFPTFSISDTHPLSGQCQWTSWYYGAHDGNDGNDGHDGHDEQVRE